jgi:peptide/nickel transport system permease protein
VPAAAPTARTHWLLRRGGLAVGTVCAALAVTFTLLTLAPGDPLATILDGRELPPEAVAQLRAVYGTDGPAPARFLRWLAAFARGELGWSIARQRPVAEVLAAALPHTLLLVATAQLASAGLGSALGAWQGAHAGSRGDRATSLVTLALFAIPEFVLALPLLLLFAWRWRVLPAGGAADAMAPYLSPLAQLGDRLAHLVLPATALTAVGVAVYARYQRAAMAGALAEPFVRAARARGASRRRAHVAHAWRAALLPVVTLLGLNLPALVGGTLLIERAFAWPGVGTVLADAIAQRDTAVVLAVVALGSAATALGALLTDLLLPRVDPRVVDG